MTDTEPDPMPPGYKLGRYIIEEELPAAGMGRVYKAQDTALNRVVAINVLAPSLRTAQGIAMFFDHFRRATEAQFKGAVDGELGSVPIKDLFDLKGVIGVALAYSEGQPVFDISTV